MTTFAVFGINNDALSTAVNVLILVLIVVWAALIFWTFADARRRIDDPLLVGCASLAEAVATRIAVPGRLQVVSDRPYTVLDGAHNPSGVAALAGEEGAVVATGSIYLVADLLSEPGRRRASAL